MSRSAKFAFTSSARFPRVSGDEPPTLHASLMQLKFSPRERG